MTGTAPRKSARQQARAAGNPPATGLMEFLDREVLSRLTAEQVFTHEAHRWKHQTATKWQGGCPWHDSKTGTAFYLDPQTLLWRCPACGIGGGPVMYLHLRAGGKGSPRGKSFVEIVRRLAELAGVQFPEREMTPAEQEHARRLEARRAILEAVAAHAQTVLWSEAGAAARAYLAERGLDEQAIRDLGIGLYLSADDVQQALRQRGYTKEDIKAAGVLWRRLEGYILFPWADDAGRPLTLYGTWTSRTPPDGRPKKLALPNPKDGETDWESTKRSPYLLDLALRAGHKSLVLLEGLTDAAVAHAHGDTRAIACVAAELSALQAQTLKRHRVESVTITLDPDKAGESGIRSCIRSLDAVGVRAYVAPQLPEGLDPDDYILRHGIDAWRKHVDRAVHAYRHEARCIIASHKPADGWTDATRDAAINAAVARGMQIPAEREDELVRHFLTEVALETGEERDRLLARVRCANTQQASDGRINERDQVWHLLDRHGMPMMAQEISTGLGTDTGATAGLLERMASDGMLLKIGDGYTVRHSDSHGGSGPAGDAHDPGAANKPEAGECSLGELLDCHQSLRPAVIHGLLRQGETANVIAASKVGKSWLVIDLALAVVTGGLWLGTFQAEPGQVLILDNELHPETLADRIRKVAVARGIDLAPLRDLVTVRVLRGRLRDIVSLRAYFEKLQPGRFKLVILDTLYRMLPADTSENDNAAMAGIYNAIDSYADRLGCCFATIHHASKGSQADKSVTDVGAGAGSMSRAADTHLVLRPHEEDEVFVLEAAVRSWPPIKPRCLRWEFPVWEPEEGLSPDLLRRPEAKRREAYKANDAKADDAILLNKLDEVDPDRTGYGKNKLRGLLDWEYRRMEASVGRLVTAEIIEECLVLVEIGNCGHRTAAGIRRTSVPDM